MLSPVEDKDDISYSNLWVDPQILLFIMALTREKKEEIVQDLQQKLGDQQGIVFVDFYQVPADSLFSFRAKLKENNCELRVTKKTLLKIALAGEDLDADYIDEFEGSVAPVFGFGSKLDLSKLVYNFSQKHSSLKILGGWWDGEFQPVETVETLAQLPSYEELMARFVGGINSPVNKFVNILNNNLKGLLLVLNQIKQQK